MATKTKALVKAPAVVPTEIGAKDLRSVMEGEAEKRALITKYISQHMKSGTDYGTIKIGGRDSKPSLFKPGSEKFLSLFKLTAKFSQDTETYQMAGAEVGLFCYVCHLVDTNRKVVGEGRGAASMKEKAWALNTCIKIAEKRAQIDAVLRTGALSDFFTQDLEDMAQGYDTSPIKDTGTVVTYGAEEELPSDTDSQWKIITNFAKQLDKKIKNKEDVERLVADRTQLALVPKNFPAIIRALETEISIKHI